MEKLILSFTLAIILFAFACNNPAKKSTKENQSSEDIIERINASNDSIFQEFVLDKIGNEHLNHISEIESLKRIKSIKCDSLGIHYKDTIDQTSIELKLGIQPFEFEKHQIKYIDHGDYKACELIDNKIPLGGFYHCPKTEIANIEVIVNNKKLDLDGKLSNYYNIDMCKIHFKNFSPNPLLTYSEEHKQFQLYILGGNAAGTYFSKLIFDKQGIIAQYVIDYGELSKTNSFYSEFKGF